MGNGLKIEIFQKFDSKLMDVWSSLQDRCEVSVFQTFEWLSLWYETVGRNSLRIKPLVMCVYHDQSPVALFPFGIRNVFGVKVLEFLGGDQVDYNAPLVSSEWMDKKNFNAAWNTLLQALPQYDVLNFPRMPEKLGEETNPMIVALSACHESYSYSACLPLSWEEFRERLPKKMLKDNARMIRRLTEKGSLEFKTARSAEDFHEFIEIMFDQKRRRYRETGARDVLADQYVQQFYRSLDRYFSGKFIVSLSVLNLDDEVLATTLGVVFKDRFSYLVPTYAAGDWPRFSPGRLLLEHLVKTSVSNQLATFDFTVGSEGYKAIWCDQKMSLYRKVEGASVIGLSFVVWLNLISWVKTNVHARYVVTTVIRCLRASSFLRK